MIVLVAVYHGKPGNGEAIAAALEKMAPQVKASEPGCTLYQACRSKEDPDLFLLYEHDVDEAALAAHRKRRTSRRSSRERSSRCSSSASASSTTWWSDSADRR